MNIFYIPSWYPDKNNPVAAVFMKEQALAIGGLNPDFNIAISLWEQGHDFDLQFRQPFKAVSTITSYLKTSPYFKPIFTNVYEVYRPTLKWSDWLLDGNLKGIVEANIKNFEEAILKFGRIDIIHAHVGFPAGYIAYLLSERFKIPYVITEHFSYVLSDDILKGSRINLKFKSAWDNAYSVIAVSPSFSHRLKGLGVANVKYIPNVIDEDFFQPPDEELSDRNSFVFFTLGNMLLNKGIDVLLNAAAEIVNDYPDFEFRIGGDGADLPYFKSLALELKVEKYVKWLGWLDRVQALQEFQNCDCFILPSRSETFGIVYAEANGCGKPVIATRCGGPEVIVQEENGVLVNVDDIDGLANAMREMKSNIQIYNKDTIRSIFLSSFSKKAVISQIVDAYKEAIGRYSH